MFKILGAKNCRKNLHKNPGPSFQIRGGPGSFSNANLVVLSLAYVYQQHVLQVICPQYLNLSTSFIFLHILIEIVVRKKRVLRGYGNKCNIIDCEYIKDLS